MSQINKLNVGCGNDIRQGYVNLDVSPLPGVDVVHNLEIFPWPFEDNSFDEIILQNVLEHLSDTIQVIEEVWRILKHKGKVIITVPYWNCWQSIADPTHKTYFHQYSFIFFDPKTKTGKERSYYSKARFNIDYRVVLKTHFQHPLPILS